MKQNINLTFSVEMPEEYIMISKKEYRELKSKSSSSECRSVGDTGQQTNYYNLYIARRENKLKQKDVAKELGIHVCTYSRKETGEKEFTLSEAFKLADMFNTTVDELFRRKI